MSTQLRPRKKRFTPDDFMPPLWAALRSVAGWHEYPRVKIMRGQQWITFCQVHHAGHYCAVDFFDREYKGEALLDCVFDDGPIHLAQGDVVKVKVLWP